MKTVCNAWSHSFAHGGHRPMWVSACSLEMLGFFILHFFHNINGSWQHLRDLYKKCQNKTGLTFLKKVKWKHLVLTSYSRMRVDLAVQVMR